MTSWGSSVSDKNIIKGPYNLSYNISLIRISPDQYSMIATDCYSYYYAYPFYDGSHRGSQQENNELRGGRKFPEKEKKRGDLLVDVFSFAPQINLFQSHSQNRSGVAPMIR